MSWINERHKGANGHIDAWSIYLCICMVSMILFIYSNRVQGQVFVENTYLHVEMDSDGDFTIDTIQGNPNEPADDNMNVFSGTATLRVEEDPDRIYSMPLTGSGSENPVPPGQGDAIQYNLTGAPAIQSSNSIRCFWIVQVPEPVGTDPALDTTPDDLIVERILTLIRDTVEVRHRITNIDDTAHVIGLRLFINTNCGRGQGAASAGPFFVPGFPVVLKEREFNAGTGIPEWWLNVLSRTQTAVQLRGTVKGGDASTPDRLAFGQATRITADNWDFTPDELYDLEYQDSAVAYYWFPMALSPGAVVEYVTYIGLNLSAAMQFRSPYALFVNVPSRLGIILGDNPFTTEEEGSYTVPNPFTIEASIFNYGEAPLTNATILLQLPQGMTLEAGYSPSVFLGNVLAGTEAKALWNVRVDPSVQGRIQFVVTANAVPGGPHAATATINIPAQAQRSLALGYHILSFPFAFTNPYPAVALGIPEEALKLARYDPKLKGYRYFPYDIQQLRPGESYWLYLDAPRTIKLNGARFITSLELPLNVPLYQGWNQVGNPFPNSIYLGGLEVSVGAVSFPYEEAVQRNYIRSHIFFWDNSANDYALPQSGNWVVLPPWQGFWIYAERDAALLFSGPMFIGPLQVRSKTDVARKFQWSMRISARTDELQDRYNVFGVALNATDGLDAFDIPEPPRPSPNVQLAFINNDNRQGSNIRRLCYDIKSATGSRKVWNFEVVCDRANADVTLHWDGLASLPKGIRPVLVDVDAGRSIYMRTNVSYRFRNMKPRQPRRFKVLVERVSNAPLRIMQLRAIPVRGRGVAFAFVLSHDARVDCTIRTLTGRVVRRISNGRIMHRGPGTIIWDGRDHAGRQQPPGIYMAVITPTTEELRSASFTVLFQLR